MATENELAEIRPDWLPNLILFEDCKGDWDKYLTKIYSLFKIDFLDSQCIFNDQKVNVKRHPLIENKEATFWHLISKGETTEERIPDIRRCERITWPKPILEKVPDENIKVWENKRKSEIRICIWLEKAEYLIVLAKRKGYILLWTAYTITRVHRKSKLMKEYLKYIKN